MNLGIWNTEPARHSVFEDAQGLFTGTVLASLGVMLLSKAGLLTGGVAGMAFLLHYAFGWSFGLGFFVINLPFYWLAYERLGIAFTIKTFSRSDCSPFCRNIIRSFLISPRSIRSGLACSAAC